jgi:hypothetical protein
VVVPGFQASLEAKLPYLTAPALTFHLADKGWTESVGKNLHIGNMKPHRCRAFLLFYLLSLILVAAWGLKPLWGPWVPVEATVYGRNRDFQVSVEADEPNEYYAVLDICYEYEGRILIDRQYLERDGPTGWRLRELVQAVEEARRHPIGEVREIVVHSDDPARWQTAPPKIWPWALLVLLYGSFTTLVAWELPALQVCSLALAVLVSFVFRSGSTAQTVSPTSDPRSLVIETMYPRAFERIPLDGPTKPESLQRALEKWGRPDAVWREQEEGHVLAYLLYRDGAGWNTTWTLNFRLAEGSWVPMGPPQSSETGPTITTPW